MPYEFLNDFLRDEAEQRRRDEKLVKREKRPNKVLDAFCDFLVVLILGFFVGVIYLACTIGSKP